MVNSCLVHILLRTFTRIAVHTHILSYIHTKLLYNTQYGRANGTIATLPVMCSVANDLLLLVARFASD